MSTVTDNTYIRVRKITQSKIKTLFNEPNTHFSFRPKLQQEIRQEINVEGTWLIEML